MEKKQYLILLHFSDPNQLTRALANLASWYPTQNRQGWLGCGFVRTGRYSGEFFFNTTLQNPMPILEKIETFFTNEGFLTLGPAQQVTMVLKRNG